MLLQIALALHKLLGVWLGLKEQLDRIEGAIKVLDQRLADILSLGKSEANDLTTIKADVADLKQKEADLETKLAQTDPADTKTIDDIKSQLVANATARAEILAQFAPAQSPVVAGEEQPPAPLS